MTQETVARSLQQQTDHAYLAYLLHWGKRQIQTRKYDDGEVALEARTYYRMVSCKERMVRPFARQVITIGRKLHHRKWTVGWTQRYSLWHPEDRIVGTLRQVAEAGENMILRRAWELEEAGKDWQ